METISVNIPFLDLAGNFPGERAHSSFRTVENVWVTKHRLLSQPSLIPLLDGLYDRGTPAGREPNVEDIHHIDGFKPLTETRDRLSSSVSFPSWTTVRVLSWLSYKLNPELEQFIEQAMEHLSTWKETEGGKVLTMGKDAIQQGETINSEVELRDRLIDLVSVGNLKHKPEALFTLFRQFLTRISLPRLIHFLDLVLPQLTPVQAAWAGEEKTLWSCHHIRWLREKQSAATPRVQISYFFSSHDNVHHVRIQWNGNPFRQQASHISNTSKLGCAKAWPSSFTQAVLIAEESVMNRDRRGENRLWKRVTPCVTELPWTSRNDVLRNKQVLVGCKGGFHQECQQPCSSVASWMEDTDVALNDEDQQCGNLDEASAIARYSQSQVP